MNDAAPAASPLTVRAILAAQRIRVAALAADSGFVRDSGFCNRCEGPVLVATRVCLCCVAVSS